ncbi:MAG TPA: serine hydrolase domain-containing protein [Sphingomicrobium sp.]|jgi:CubicO group peptidase (beta-lactamase class C family)|nr:serine hydrolase domain-containing protein [Sphingomicrobium sp.]
MLKSALALLAVVAAPAAAQPLSPAEVSQIDQLVAKTLADTGVPSAEIAVVRDGKLVLNKAYGKANEGLPANPGLPYQIASNSKQFTAMALLLLEDEGKLSLDDHVSKYIPAVTEGDKITIRELLSHTSGLQDFWPQDFMFKTMTVPTTPQGIVDRWAKKPLDYEPGTRWQYSNTGYVVAGMIAEKVSGEPLMTYLYRKIFTPLGMHPLDQDKTNTPAYPAGYHRYALGPVRVATPPAPGWLYAAGELSMTASDLAKWDIARMNRALIPAEDWIEQETPVLRKDGRTNGYGLGVYNHYQRERHVIDHGGEAVGFLTQNTVYPDTNDAIIVFTNSDFSGATDTITEGIEDIVLNAPEPALTGESDRTDDVRAIYASLVSGTLDRAKFTDDLNYYFDATTLGDYKASLAPLGTPTITMLRAPKLRGGFVNRVYRLHYPSGCDLFLSTYAEPGDNGRWEQFLVMPE